MPTAINRIVQTLRFASVHQDEAAQTDRALLEAFAESGDETAFAELVRRHGSLVFGVCRRILDNVHDAEDAFQATFLVLARKAASVAWHDCVKNWLHGVAYRIAMKARGQKRRRCDVEKQAVGRTEQAVCDDLRLILDEELQRMPEKYSAPLLLCYLEGKTRDEAAEELGWSVGSVKGRLERGRELLRSRLAKRGLTLSIVLTTSLLGQAANAAVPTALSVATVHAGLHFVAGASAHSAIAGSVINLAQGALHTMMIAKIKVAGMLATLVLCAVGATVAVHQAATEQAVASGAPVQAAALAQEKKDEPRKKKDGERTKKDDILGLIKELDIKIGKLTITHLRENMPGDGVYGLADKNIKITSNFGDKLTLADLQVGMRVHLELKTDADVIAIVVENPQFFGALGSIDAATRMVELRGERKITTVKVAPDATIKVFGKAAKLAEVPINERSQITMSFDRKAILAITVGKAGGAERPVPPRKDGERPAVERVPDRVPGNVGTIVDVDAVKGTLNFLSGGTDDPTLRTLAVAKDLAVKVTFEEKAVLEMPFDKLTKPLPAVVQLSEDQKTVIGLSVRAPVVRGTVKSVDAAGSKITLEMGREETVYTVAPDAFLRLNGRGTKLADLKAGDSVTLGMSLDRQRVIGIASQTRRGDGER